MTKLTTLGRRALPALIALATACSAAIDSDEDFEVDEAETTEEAAVGDQCPAPTGISWNGRSRFMHGVNYAWGQFGGDFGGVSRWNVKGVAGSAGDHAAKLADMRANGAGVIRWWMFPEFRGEGVRFDGSEKPIGLGGTALQDLNKALELADKADVYLMLCLFSFDNFRPSHSSSGIYIPGMAPIVRDTSKLNSLIDTVVRPVARAVEASPYKHRMIAWDVINEPEWAITGQNPYGDERYTPMSELDAVNHAEMERFISRAANALQAESSALVTVGGAAAKWAKAWSRVNIDFYQIHIYDWVNQYWPYYRSPSELGLGDKPVVMGEFPIQGLSGVSYQTLVDSLYSNGYAGAMGWAYNDATREQLGQMRQFSAKHACETNYSAGYGETGGSTGGGGASCSDTPPNNRFTCAQQAEWGKCGESWMQGFCNRTCGRCSATTCSDTPPDSRFTCAQQAEWGKCGEGWMQGYCDRSCGRCQ